MSKKYKVSVVTGTRAEYGLLRGTLFELQKRSDIETELVVTGSHLSAAFGNTQDEIIKDGFSDFVRIEIPIDDDSRFGMADSTGVAISKFAGYLKGSAPNILVVLGDRFEIFAIVSAAHLCGIPVAHIGGGDVTEGAVDDAIRHCITKMSLIHFPGCEQSAKRIIQLGEEPCRVFNVGEPGVENCMNLQLLDRGELAESIGFDDVKKDYSVVTFHPVTMEDDTAAIQVRELISAMNKMPDMSYIITMANADAGGRLINNIWQHEAENHKNWLLVSSLGVLRYLSSVKYAKLVIGNSSSGMIEAPALKVPTINIGDRQKGRMVAESVICCEPECDSIYNAMQKGMSDDFAQGASDSANPYGDGHTSEKIVSIIADYLNENRKSNEKSFYDINFEY